MALIDLRRFLRRLADQGELREISEEVDWNLEASALCAASNAGGGPALWFRRIKGYPEGSGLAGSLFAGPGNLQMSARRPWTRLALALELEGDLPYEELIEEILERRDNPIAPIAVTTGSCKEEVHVGNDVDVLELPVPLLHRSDGGRYGTMGVVTVRDPETGWQNWSLQRWMVRSGSELVLPLSPGRHLTLIHGKYEARGEAMPVCIALGGNPALAVAAAMSLPTGISEVDVASGLSLDPIQLVKAETNDLLVPADAEIVIEGEVRPGERADEGPFPGYARLLPQTAQPLVRVKAITHRRNPVLPFAVQSGIGDSLCLLSTLISAELLAYSRNEFVHTRWINLPVEGKLGLCIVSTGVPYNGYVSRFARYLFAYPQKWFDKILFVDADVEPVDLGQCLLDMIQKVHPQRDVRKTELTYPPPLNCAYPTPEGLTGRLVLDATWPVGLEKSQLPRRVAFETVYPPEVQRRVIEGWQTVFGLEGEPIVSRALAKRLGLEEKR